MESLGFFAQLTLMQVSARVKWKLSLTSYSWQLELIVLPDQMILHRCHPRNFTWTENLGFGWVLTLWRYEVQKTASYLSFIGNAVCWLYESASCMRKTSIETQYSTILNMQWRKDSQNQGHSRLMAEIFQIYCNVAMNWTSLYCNGNCMKESSS